ncbi:MAG: hypothetical protein A2252_05170 [Elusimicrobia bacterium RIFOXYA2_FULL_39_19]|nr:MAG: hypothetical protein A2252_05170 [Elusimicrobia bacterium RIFOXYA2_FULL_39_19]
MFQNLRNKVFKITFVVFVLWLILIFVFGKSSVWSSIVAGVFTGLINLFVMALTTEKMFLSVAKPKIWNYVWRTFFFRIPLIVLFLLFLFLIVKVNLPGFMAGLIVGSIAGIFRISKSCQLSRKV